MMTVQVGSRLEILADVIVEVWLHTQACVSVVNEHENHD